MTLIRDHDGQYANLDTATQMGFHRLPDKNDEPGPGIGVVTTPRKTHEITNDAEILKLRNYITSHDAPPDGPRGS